MKKLGWLSISLILLAVLLQPSFAFAQSETDWIVETFAGIDKIIALLSRLWIIPASIAGKLMSNSVVYGTAFYLDTYLFKIRQFMRSMAYFTLGFVFVGRIVVIFFKQEAVSKIRDLVKNVAIAGLLIPMTRFLVAALVDFSIIATSAVSAFPQQVMQEQRTLIQDDIVVNKRIIVDNKDISLEDKNREGNLQSVTFEDILPQGDSVAGPFVFMGAGMLNLFNLRDISEAERNGGRLLLITVLKLIITLMLVVPMIALMVINFQRIFYLWLRIIFSPFIVLDYVFKGPLSGGSSDYKEKFSPSNILGLIFMPVVIIGLLSIGMVLIFGVYSTFSGGHEYEEGAALGELQIRQHGDNYATIGTEETSEITIQGDFFTNMGSKIGGAIGELILAAIVAIIFWGLMMVGFRFSSLTAKTSDAIFSFAGSMAKTVPVVPVPGMGMVPVGALQRAKKDIESDSFGLDTKRAYQARGASEAVRDMFGMDKKPESLDSVEIQELRALTTESGAESNAFGFWKKLKELQRKKDIKMETIKPLINSRLSNSSQGRLAMGNFLGKTIDPNDVESVWQNENFKRFIDGFMSEDHNVSALNSTDQAESFFKRMRTKGNNVERPRYNKVRSPQGSSGS